MDRKEKIKIESEPFENSESVEQQTEEVQEVQELAKEPPVSIEREYYRPAEIATPPAVEEETTDESYSLEKVIKDSVQTHLGEAYRGISDEVRARAKSEGAIFLQDAAELLRGIDEKNRGRTTELLHTKALKFTHTLGASRYFAESAALAITQELLEKTYPEV